jgi:arylsulfatase A-like enzyme
MVAGILMGVVVCLVGCKQEEVVEKGPPLSTAKHVVIMSVDGCRPDVLLRAQMQILAKGEKPAVMQLMKEGSFSMWAQTIPASVTLPSHTSMLTGVEMEVHGINWNKEEKEGEPVVYPAVPTLFELAKQKGLTTAIFASKTKFFGLAKPGTIDWGFINKDEETWASDAEMAATAAYVIRAHKPNVTFVHFAEVDWIGHGRIKDWDGEVRTDSKRGWGSQMQVDRIEMEDHNIGVVVQALKDAGIYDDTLIIISADHGGAGYWHGANDPRARHIPWICVGPKVRANYDLNRARISPSQRLTVKTTDTFATACYFLQIPIPENVTGRPVVEMIKKDELLSPATTATAPATP